MVSGCAIDFQHFLLNSRTCSSARGVRRQAVWFWGLTCGLAPNFKNNRPIAYKNNDTCENYFTANQESEKTKCNKKYKYWEFSHSAGLSTLHYPVAPPLPGHLAVPTTVDYHKNCWIIIALGAQWFGPAIDSTTFNYILHLVLLPGECDAGWCGLGADKWLTPIFKKL